MHSRIFELSAQQMHPDDYVQKDYFYGYDGIVNGFTGHIADHVSDEVDRDESIEWLIKYLQNNAGKKYFTFNEEEGYIVFHKGFKTAYFRERYQKFKRIANNLTLDEFSGEGSAPIEYILKLADLKNLIQKTHGFYVLRKDDGSNVIQTLDSFVRHSVYHKRYYIGGVMDYHYRFQ